MTDDQKLVLQARLDHASLVAGIYLDREAVLAEIQLMSADALAAEAKPIRERLEARRADDAAAEVHAIRVKATTFVKKMNYLNLARGESPEPGLLPVIAAVRNLMGTNDALAAARLNNPAASADDVTEAEKLVDAAIQEYIAAKNI